MEKMYVLPVNTENLDKILLSRQKKLAKQIETFSKNYVTIKCDKFGNEEKNFNPLAVANYFFEPINPMPNVQPIYDSVQLSKVWDLYQKIIIKINLEIGVFNPTLSHFAKFVGITLETIRELKQSGEEAMRTLIGKIEDEIYDSNIMLAQSKKIVTSPTTYRMKYENEALEKKTPTVNVNIVKNVDIDLNKINARVNEIEKITSGMAEYNGGGSYTSGVIEYNG